MVSTGHCHSVNNSVRLAVPSTGSAKAAACTVLFASQLLFTQRCFSPFSSSKGENQTYLLVPNVTTAILKHIVLSALEKNSLKKVYY